MELPTSLQKLYMDLLKTKRNSESFCDPRPIVVVCAVPAPMREEALRQLLALDMDTGNYMIGNVMSSDAVLRHGVGLITLDKTEHLMLPIHDSVRTFIFSDAARDTIRDLMTTVRVPVGAFFNSVATALILRVKDESSQLRGWESEATTYIGRACLLHIKHRASRTMGTASSKARVTLPTVSANVPPCLRKPMRAIWPRFNDRSFVRVDATSIHATSARDESLAQQEDFFYYARDNWLACNRSLAAFLEHRDRAQRELENTPMASLDAN
jgi:hypothetical protein